MLKLNNISAQPGSVHKRKRLGRGVGSGHGMTSGKGDKGQLARSGGTSRPGFEGGQMPLYRRIPKRGFQNFARRTNAIVNLVDIEKMGIKDVTLESLASSNLIKGRFDRLTVLGIGEIKKAINVKAHRVSASAQEKIKKAGGKVELIPIPKGKKPRRARDVKNAAAQNTKTKK